MCIWYHVLRWYMIHVLQMFWGYDIPLILVSIFVASSLYNQFITRYNIGPAGWMESCPPPWRISTICAIRTLRKDRRTRYIFYVFWNNIKTRINDNLCYLRNSPCIFPVVPFSSTLQRIWVCKALWMPVCDESLSRFHEGDLGSVSISDKTSYRKISKPRDW